MRLQRLVNKLLAYLLDSDVEMYDGGLSIHNQDDHDDVLDHIKDDHK